jgi:hypothetical protein
MQHTRAAPNAQASAQPPVPPPAGLVMEAPHYVLLTKYYQRGTLLKLLHDTPQLSWQHRLGLALQVGGSWATESCCTRPAGPWGRASWATGSNCHCCALQC